MSLRINTNVDALNVHNSLVNTSDKISTSLKRLSSGYRINSARDDASGFAIANSFSAKVGSMKVASQNASEAQSMLQVADGAYSKVNDILVRMKNLATQAASGQTESLTTMNNEFASLQKEIDRISGSTTYGTKNLTDGNSTVASNGVTFQVGATNATNNQINLKFSGAMAGCLGGEQQRHQPQHGSRRRQGHGCHRCGPHLHQLLHGRHRCLPEPLAVHD